jgi:pilus assembly protein FimV
MRKKIRKATLQYRVKSIGAAALLLCVSFAGDALTLGGIRGPVIIGRPLDVTIPVQVEQKDDSAAACFGADVFHADVQQPPARVRVQVESTDSAQSILVRVLSSTLVNEPVVSVTLRTRCDLKTERRYVLLADLPKAADPAVPVQIGQNSAPIRSTPVLPPSVVADAGARSGAADKPAAPQKAPRSKVERPVKELRQSAVKTGDAALKRTTAPSSQPRLHLDNLELFSDRISLIDMEQPDTAGDYVSPDLQKVQDMQGTVDSLQSLLAKNENSLSELTARLHQAETERFPAWLVYALAALILTAIAAISVLWARQRRLHDEDGEWWSASVVSPDSFAPAPAGAVGSVPQALAPAIQPVVEPRLEKSWTFPPASQWHDSRTPGVDVSEVEMGESRFDRFMQSGEVQDGAGVQSAAAPLDLVLPESESLDTVLIAELRQQAEFFVALGQTDQAVVVLEKLVHESAVPNPHVYLDLLGLLHSLSKKMEFQRFREGFNRAFNGVVPEFVRFKSEGKSLEAYPAVLADVVAHWATPEALDCINAYVLKNKRNAQRGALDLAAFRDLLLLQSIVQQLSDDAANHLGEPVALHRGVDSSNDPAVVDPSDAQIGSMMDLDLDLSEEVDSAHDGLNEGAALPATVPTSLKVNGLTPSENDNLIDFDLPDAGKPDEKPPKS